jgi:uncharacterized membrane protein
MFNAKQKHMLIFQEHKNRAIESGKGHAINPNQVHDEFQASLGFNGKVARVMTGIFGSMWFVYFLVVFTAGWMLWESHFDNKPLDPYPFAFLLFIGNLVQLIGGPIIQVGQNFASAHSELRAEADYEVNKKSFEHIEAMQKRLEKLEQENHEMIKWLKDNAAIRIDNAERD